jgi:hypothetical protein
MFRGSSQLFIISSCFRFAEGIGNKASEERHTQKEKNKREEKGR